MITKRLNIFDIACEEVKKYCDTYFKVIAAYATAGNVTGDDKSVNPSYPTTLLAYQLNDYHVFELLGSTKNYKNLSLIKRKNIRHIDDVLGNFKTSATKNLYTFAGTGCSLLGLRIMSKRDVENFNTRYPGMDTIHKSILQLEDVSEWESFNAISLVDPKCNIKSFWLNNILTVNSYKNIVRMRYFQTLVVLDKYVDIKNVFEKLFPINGNMHLLVSIDGDVNGVHLNRAANFASLTSIKTPETTIGKFLDENSDILLSALNAIKIIPQPKLEWIKKISGNNKSTIIPDFIFVDHQGNAHLCDLKLPLLDKKSLTKGDRERRRFIDNVAEGISQLANYEEYFTYPENANYALKKYGITMNKPRKVLIVGSFENFNADKVSEANRERGANAPEIIDYDTLRNAYLMNKGVLSH